MKRIGILGDIGSGKSYVAKKFGYPVFDADEEVKKLYKNNRKIFYDLKKRLPSYIHSFPVKKEEITKAILSNKNNLKKIIKIVHVEVRKKMNLFIKKYNKKNIVILDIPLLLENKINKKGDILIFVKAKKSEIFKRLKKRKNFNSKLMKKFRKIQLPIVLKERRSHFVIKNNFTKQSIQKDVNNILRRIY